MNKMARVTPRVRTELGIKVWTVATIYVASEVMRIFIIHFAKSLALQGRDECEGIEMIPMRLNSSPSIPISFI